MMRDASLVGGLLVALAALDGSFAGFRSSAGRTGLIRHRPYDLLAAVRGLGTVAVLITPIVVVAAIDVSGDAERASAYVSAGQVMLAVYLPFAAMVLAALACYGLLAWRYRFLATAVILGPFTLLRPLVAVVGAGAGASHDAVVAGLAVLSAAAVLTVEPLTDRLWYDPRGEPGTGRN